MFLSRAKGSMVIGLWLELILEVLGRLLLVFLLCIHQNHLRLLTLYYFTGYVAGRQYERDVVFGLSSFHCLEGNLV